MRAPIVLLRHPAVIQTDAHEPMASLSLPQHADQALQVEVVVLTAETNPGHLDREVVLGNDRRVPATFNLVGHPVNLPALLIVLELRAGVRERRAEPFLDAVAASLQLGLEPGRIVDGVSGALLGGQAGPAQLIGFDHPGQSLAEVSRRSGIVPGLRPIVPALGAVKPCLDHLKKLGFLDQSDVNQAVDPKPGIGSMSRQAQPSVFLAQADDKPEQGKQLEVLSPLAKARRSDQLRRGRGLGSKDAPAFKVVGLDLEPANDSGDSNLDDASGNRRCQEFTCEGLILGLRQSFQCLANPLG